MGKLMIHFYHSSTTLIFNNYSLVKSFSYCIIDRLACDHTILITITSSDNQIFSLFSDITHHFVLLFRSKDYFVDLKNLNIEPKINCTV